MGVEQLMRAKWPIFVSVISWAVLSTPAIARENGSAKNPSAWISCLNDVAKKFPDTASPEREAGNAECTSQFGDDFETSRLKRPLPSAAEYIAMRAEAERYLTRNFFDPQSAVFEWPTGFLYGKWKPLLRRSVTGYISCGWVNAKNRMGGYVGRRAFVVVMDGQRIIFSDIDGAELDVVGRTCKARSMEFPPPQIVPSISEPIPTVRNDVAQSLTQLAALLERGLITRDEFEAEKARLLRSPD